MPGTHWLERQGMRRACSPTVDPNLRDVIFQVPFICLGLGVFTDTPWKQGQIQPIYEKKIHHNVMYILVKNPEEKSTGMSGEQDGTRTCIKARRGRKDARLLWPGRRRVRWEGVPAMTR
ncbi:hypothetical protein [Cupriavidus necator]|uniref:hypothetical protein n=1 Tax=Cupriavidus necator TaxID=106590 RepID=UPI003F73A5F3